MELRGLVHVSCVKCPEFESQHHKTYVKQLLDLTYLNLRGIGMMFKMTKEDLDRKLS